MTAPHRFFLFLILICFVPSASLAAKPLDIFDTLKPFSPSLPSLEGIDFNLDNLKTEELPIALKHYERAFKKAVSREEKNLLALAIGHLHALQGNYPASSKHLQNDILGNFVLEDFRLNILALAAKEQGIVELEQKHYSAAIALFKESEKFRLKLFRFYPDSPFHAKVSRELAGLEQLLGDAYFQAFNYKAAWQTYRRALMREFSDNEEFRLNVRLSLAQTYAAAGDLAGAADIYAALLKNSDSLEAKEASLNFFNVYESKLKQEKIDLKDLKLEDYLPAKPGTTNGKPLPPRKTPRTVYENKMVGDFHASLEHEDTETSLKLGLDVLKNYPGIQEARGVRKKIKILITSHLKTNPMIGVIEEIIDLYPVETLNKLGYLLWKENLPHHAARFYGKILEKYPLETAACHKASYFLGRIAEDKGEYAQAIYYYDQLINKYDYGSYTTAALFKIPWIERLEKKYDLAREHFNRLLDFYASKAYRRLSASWPDSSSYKTAALFWLAQTEGESGNPDKKTVLIKQLAEKYPFDFYTIFTKDESDLNLQEFLTQKNSQEVAFRYFGLGEVGRKRLSRTEKLIAAGFRNQAAEELAMLTSRQDNPAFSFYIAQLFQLGGRFQEAMRLSWQIAGNGKHDQLSRSVSEGLFPKAYLQEVREVLTRYELDPLLVLSLMRQESAFNPGIVSQANAVGLMQLILPTAAEVARSLRHEIPSEESLKDPETNLRLGIDYLNYLMDSFNQNMVYALAGYNAGPNKVQEWVTLRPNLYPLEFIESIPYTETRNYVKKVLRNYAIYLALYGDQNFNRLKEILTISYN